MLSKNNAPLKNRQNAYAGIQNAPVQSKREIPDMEQRGAHLAAALTQVSMQAKAVVNTLRPTSPVPQIGVNMSALRNALSADLKAVKKAEGDGGNDGASILGEKRSIRVRAPIGTRVSVLATKFGHDDRSVAVTGTTTIANKTSDTRAALTAGRVPLDGELTAEQTQHMTSTGISLAHAVTLQRMADRANVVIGVRKVEQAAAERIEQGAQTKNLSVKGKSADWGLHRGFIPVDQALNKHAGHLTPQSPEAIARANEAMQKLLDSQDGAASFSGVRDYTTSRDHAVLKVTHFAKDGVFTPLRQAPARARIIAMPLIVPFDELREAGALSFHPDGTAEFIMTEPRGAAWRWKVLPECREEGDRYAIYYREATDVVHAPYRPLEVVGYRFGGVGATGKSEVGQDGTPRAVDMKVTADFDLLMVMPHVADLGPQDNVDVPLLTARAYPGMKSSRRDGGVSPLAGVPRAFKRTEHGNASAAISKLIDDAETVFPAFPGLPNGAGKVNAGIRALIHHSHDLLNPHTDEASNYPALVVVPGLRYGQVVRNRQEFDLIHQDLERQGFIGFKNPFWERQR